MIEYLYDFYEELKREGVMFCFSGPSTQSIVEGIGEAIKRKMEVEDADIATTQRIFSIFVEQMQNIINYSADHDYYDEDNGNVRSGVIVVGRSKGKFYVICGNKVKQEQSRQIEERLVALQNMDKRQLKEHYKNMRRQPPSPDSKGAGLGFIEMFRRSSEPLEFRVTPLDDGAVFFAIKTVG